MAKGPQFDFHELDELIHSRARLGIMSILTAVDEADFAYLKEKLAVTDGNLGAHLRKLEDAGYITVKKEFVGRRPRTSYSITQVGRRAFEAYLKELEKLVREIQ